MHGLKSRLASAHKTRLSRELTAMLSGGGAPGPACHSLCQADRAVTSCKKVAVASHQLPFSFPHMAISRFQALQLRVSLYAQTHQTLIFHLQKKIALLLRP